MGVSLSNGHKAVAQSGSEFHMQLVAFFSRRRDFDVTSAVEWERGPQLTPEAVISGRATAVGLVIVFADEPRSASASVQTGHILAAGQHHGTVFTSVTGIAGAVVVRDAVWNVPRYLQHYS